MSVVCVVVEVKITLVAFKISVTIISLRVAFEIAAEFKTKIGFAILTMALSVCGICVCIARNAGFNRARRTIFHIKK